MKKPEINSVFQGRSLLAEKDFTPAEVQYLVDFAIHLKALKKARIPHRYLEGQSIALLFAKTSTRTRAAFTVACVDLGSAPEYLGKDDIQLGIKESTEDTAKVLGSMFDGIERRGFSQTEVEELAKYSGVPVWNGLTDMWHPTQMIADFMTMKEEFGYLKGLKLAYVGDGRNNMANSLIVTGSMLGVDVSIVAPDSLQPTEEVMEIARKFAKDSGAHPEATSDLEKGVKGANVVYSDVWVSMGESNWEERVKLLTPYRVTMDVMKMTGTPDDELIFMHCLPAFHDTNTTYGKEIEKEYGLTEMEVTDEVFNSKYARQFEEAENRMHSIKAIMAATAGNLFIPAVPPLES